MKRRIKRKELKLLEPESSNSSSLFSKSKKPSPIGSKIDQIPNIVKIQKEHKKNKRKRAERKTSMFQALQLYSENKVETKKNSPSSKNRSILNSPQNFNNFS